MGLLWGRVRAGPGLRHYDCGSYGAFLFPGVALGLIPGFGGIPRLKRDLGNAVVRDLLLTGRSFNAMKAQQIGLVSQIAAEGEALRVARATASQVGKFRPATSAAAKKFVKPIPYQELKQEIDIFCGFYAQPAVEEGLRKFVDNGRTAVFAMNFGLVICKLRLRTFTHADAYS